MHYSEGAEERVRQGSVRRGGGDFRADYLVPQSDDPSDEKGYGCFYRSRNHGYLVKGTRMVFAAAEFKGVNQQELDWRGNRTVQVIVRDR